MKSLKKFIAEAEAVFKIGDETVTFKKWLSSSAKDESKDVFKDAIIKAFFRKLDMGKSVDANTHMKRNANMSFEDKVKYLKGIGVKTTGKILMAHRDFT